MSKNRKSFNTTLDVDLMKQIKFLALSKEKNANDLLEEGMRFVLKKYQFIEENVDFTLEELKQLESAVKMRWAVDDAQEKRQQWEKIHQKLLVMIEMKEEELN